MRLRTRDGKHHASGFYWDGSRRRRWRRSTGVEDDGSARARRLAEQVGHQIAQSYAVGGVRRARPCTLKAAIAIHIAALERARRAQATIDIVNEKAVKLFAYFGPDFDCNAIDDAALERYVDERRKQSGKRKGQPPAPLTIHRELLTLRAAIDDARSAGKFDGVTPAMPDLGKLYTPKERWLPTAETKALLLAVNPKWRDHVVMYRLLGLDEGELYALEPSDYDRGARELHIRGTKNDHRVRVLALTDETIEILERRLKLSPMFPRWSGNNVALKRACTKAEIERCCLKDLRRSYATELAIAGVPILHLMALMGHASGRMLEQVYARVQRGQHLHQAVAQLAPLRPVAPASDVEKA